MHVLVIGSGAIGSFYGSLLARQGIEVSMMARSDYDVIREKGIQVKSDVIEDYHFIPHTVIRSGRDLTEKPDIILLCVKLVAGVDRVALLQNAVGPKTAIVLISNGIDIEAEIQAAFPENEIISGLAFIGVTRMAPGEIWHQSYGRLLLGNCPEGYSKRAADLAEVIARNGIDCKPTSTITTARWQKCVWNGAFNPLSVLAGKLDTQALLTHHEDLLRNIMQEICTIASASGHSLPEDTIDKSIHGTRKMQAYKTSMLVDFESGNPLETEAILGNALRQAARLGVSAPRLDMLYRLLQTVGP